MEFVKDGWTPTGMLRFVERLVTVGPGPPPIGRTVKILQQLWARVEGQRIAEWRDVAMEQEDGTTDVEV